MDLYVQQRQKIQHLEAHINILEKTLKDLEDKNTTLGEENQHLKDIIAGLNIEIAKYKQELADEKTAHQKTQEKLDKQVVEYKKVYDKQKDLEKQLKGKKDLWTKAEEKLTNTLIESSTAVIGAGIGSVVPGVGTAVGGAIGGVIGKGITFVKDSDIGADLAEGM
ncbi:MAG: hypothetical protein AB3N34_01250 [Lettuce witches'-broom phytoplasma]